MPRLSLHHLRCYLRAIIHDCGIVRLLFRYYVVAYSPRVDSKSVRAVMRNKFFRFNNILAITAMRKEYNGQNKVLHKGLETRRLMGATKSTSFSISDVGPPSHSSRAVTSRIAISPERGQTFDDSISRQYARR